MDVCVCVCVCACPTPYSSHSPPLPLPLDQLCKYLEEFGPALAGYRLSAALDPEWGAPGEQADMLAHHLQLFHHLIQDKVGAQEAGGTGPSPPPPPPQ